MRKQLSIILAICAFLALSACTNRYIDEEPIGNDWHVWGVYDFVKVGEISVGIGRAYDEESRQIGYDIYADGQSQGPLLGEIRCTDGGFSPEDLDIDAFLLFEDYNGDGITDVGAPFKSGTILWYVQHKDEENGTEFTFSGVQEVDAAANPEAGAE